MNFWNDLKIRLNALAQVNFADGPINNIKPLDGGTGPKQLTIGNQDYVAKNDSAALIHEPLAHKLGTNLGMNIPETKIKNLPLGPNGQTQMHSVQKKVSGITGNKMMGLTEQQGQEPGRPEQIPPQLKNHPDMISMFFGDYQNNAPDRHAGNYLYDQQSNRVHAIDNAGMFSNLGSAWKQHNFPQSTQNAFAARIPRNINHLDQNASLPENMRQGYAQANPEQYAKTIMDHYQNIHQMQNKQPMSAKTQNYIQKTRIDPYLKRMMLMKQHLNNPAVQTVGHLNNALFGNKL